MPKEDLLFYSAYESFYAMAKESKAFQAFCRDAFDADFSQDGFSDKAQIDRILPYVPPKNACILDVGCGNGKMLGYLQQNTGARIFGFDYSTEAIETANRLFPTDSDFRVGIIGEAEYPEESFDVITSMDTIYFASDMTAFVAQVKRWLKPGGVFFVGYQEGDVIPKTQGMETSEIAKALLQNRMSFSWQDVTRETYDLLKRKREAALAHKGDFMDEGNEAWFDLLMMQTESVTADYEVFRRAIARYLVVANK